jgi:hypothetical protein
MKAIKNDVFLKDLEKKPTLISNMLQYTPINLIKNLIDGTNVEKEDLLFDHGIDKKVYYGQYTTNTDQGIRICP